jgi:hypothetical protein
MNKKFYFLVLLFPVFSCSNYSLYTGTERQKSITDIPLVPHQNNVDVYFNNEQPAQPYYKVKVIEANGSSNASYEALLNSLKQEAAAAGLDGVLIIEKQQAVVYNNVVHHQEATAYQTLSAVGLKYVANIGYMDTIVKSTIVDVYNDDKARKLTVLFDYYGNMLNTTDKYAAQFYADYIAPFDIQKHDAASVTGWEYSYDEFNRVYSFKISEMQEVVASAMVQSSSSGRINTVQYKIKDPILKKNIRYTLQCIYNSADKLIGKQLLSKDKMLWTEKISYNENTIAGYSRYSAADETERLIFKADNYFFSQTDLPKPVDPGTVK